MYGLPSVAADEVSSSFTEVQPEQEEKEVSLFVNFLEYTAIQWFLVENVFFYSKLNIRT